MSRQQFFRLLETTCNSLSGYGLFGFYFNALPWSVWAARVGAVSSVSCPGWRALPGDLVVCRGAELLRFWQVQAAGDGVSAGGVLCALLGESCADRSAKKPGPCSELPPDTGFPLPTLLLGGWSPMQVGKAAGLDARNQQLGSCRRLSILAG